MFSLKKSKVSKHSSVLSIDPIPFSSNPFDSDGEIDRKETRYSSRTISSKLTPVKSNFSTNPFDDNDDNGEVIHPPSSNKLAWSARSKYKNDFRDHGGIQNQSVQELEDYAAYKAEETTNLVNGCLKISEEIREEATRTLVTLHQQGEQITRTHHVAADIDYDLNRGEKLLGSLGGIFSKTWKPKKTRQIKGPVITGDDYVGRKNSNHLEQREKLGLTRAPKECSKIPLSEPTIAVQKVEVEKMKQDDALSDLSNILGDLKAMAIDMGTELGRQNKALDGFHDDVDEINFRVLDANRRGRHLLKK